MGNPQEAQRQLGLPERPDYGPTQVREVDELIEGNTYILHRTYPQKNQPSIIDDEQFLVLDRPHRIDDGSWKVRVRFTDRLGHERLSDQFLTDMGIVMYERDRGNFWNPFAWVEDPLKDPVKAEERARELFADSYRRLHESGALEFVVNEVEQRPNLTLFYAGTYEAAGGRGMPAAVSVSSPYRYPRLQETDRGLVEVAERKTVIVFAGLNHDPRIDRGIEVEIHHGRLTTTLDSPGDDIKQVPSSSLVRREQLHSWNLDRILSELLDELMRFAQNH